MHSATTIGCLRNTTHEEGEYTKNKKIIEMCHYKTRPIA